MDQPFNLRYELRAYESTDACRLASILKSLGSPVPRDQVVARWAHLYPRHASHTGKTIRARISKALSLLKVAGIVGVEDSSIVIVNRERLDMAVSNLSIVEDSDGAAVRPALWARSPTVPEHLRAVFEPLEQQRLAVAKGLRGV